MGREGTPGAPTREPERRVVARVLRADPFFGSLLTIRIGAVFLVNIFRDKRFGWYRVTPLALSVDSWLEAVPAEPSPGNYCVPLKLDSGKEFHWEVPYAQGQ